MNSPRMPIDFNVDPIPPELAQLNKLCIEGRISSMVVIARTTDNKWIECFGLALGDGDTEENADPYGMLGAMESVKRDFMRVFMPSRIEYVEIDSEEEGEDE